GAGGISTCALYLRQSDGRFVLRAQVGYPIPERDRPDPIPGHSVLLERVLEEGAPVLIPSTTVTAEMARDLLELFGTHSALLVPIVWRGERVGVLLMASTRNNLGDEDWLAFARAVAVQIGQAVVLSAAVSRLAVSEKHYRTLFEVAHDAILVADDAGRIVDANPAACALTGYAAEELRTLRVHDLLPAMERAADAAAGTRDEDHALVCGGGGQKQVELSVNRAPAGGSVYALRDVTDHRRLQSQYMQSEKLATMSQMLAGVAHELNNPLSVVKGHADLLRLAVAQGPLAARVEKIGQAAERCTRIVRNFLSLARQYPPERKATKLNQLVQEAVELLGYQLRTSGIEMRLDLARDLPPLWADPHQLHQVLVNLITNAQQAMRDQSGPKQLVLTTWAGRAGERVVLEVADTGSGIAGDVLARIFEPFFTTKAPGEGTGLGLSICRGIVEGHSGTLTVRSEPGRGAVFAVDLPAGTVRETAAPAPATDPAPRAGGWAILVVDDEADVRSLVVELLLTDGHRADAVPNGLAALEALREWSYDVIISDARMPGLDGAGLYRRLQAERPELTRRFILMTGDALTAKTREFIEEARVVSLAKPFPLDEMRRVIRQVLGDG
ncbi:MAG: response regulator, partial [Candidatus Rokubacteria bacterium]|nr:response regulator [Candidatus Rokubacteria bacterium]